MVSALIGCAAPAFSLGGTISCAAANFLTFSVPSFILLFAVIFIVLGKILSVTEQLAVMVFLTSATAAYLLLTAQFAVGGMISMNVLVVATGVVFTGFVLSKVAKRKMIDALKQCTSWKDNSNLTKKLGRLEEEWVQELLQSGDVEAVAEALGVDVSRIWDMFPTARIVSLDAPSANGNGTTLASRVADENAEAPGEAAQQRDRARLADAALRELDRRRKNWGTMLRLAAYEQWPMNRIAKRLDYHEEYVRSRISYARKTMRCVKKKADGALSLLSARQLAFDDAVVEWLRQCLSRLRTA